MKKEKLDNEISKAWYRHASGVQISIMDIPKIFEDCRRQVLTDGLTVEQAVQLAVGKYRKNLPSKGDAL